MQISSLNAKAASTSEGVRTPEAVEEAVFTVPFRQNPFFVPRDDIFAQLEDAICERGMAALCGPSGTGKSQIAIEYAYRFRQRLPRGHVFWISAENSNQVDRTYDIVAQRLELPSFTACSANILQVLHNLTYREDAASDQRPWLMICDDLNIAHGTDERFQGQPPMETPSAHELAAVQEAARRLLDQHGTLIVTARSLHTSTALVTHMPQVKVGSFSREQSVKLFVARRPDTWFGPQPTEDVNLLLNSVEDVPLAITYAIAMLQANGGQSIAEVARDILKQSNRDDELLNAELQLLDDTVRWSRQILKAWNTLFQFLLNRDRQIVDVLSLISFIDSQHIPIDFLTWTTRPVENAVKNIATLLRHSIVVVEKDTGFLSLHPLTQLFVRCWLRKEDHYSTHAQSALRSMVSILANEDVNALQIWRQYIPHAKTILKHNLRLGRTPGCAELLHHIAHYEWRVGHVDDAYKSAVEAFDIRRDRFGDEGEETLSSLSLVGVLLRCLGRSDEAFETSRQNLLSYTRILGADHPNTLMASNNMALVLRSQGKFGEAEELSRRTLESCEQMFGIHDVRTSTAIANLALLLEDQGKLEQAEVMSRRVLAMRESALSHKHQSTLTSYYCLAHLLHRKGSYHEASVLYRRAYHGFRHLLGSSHPMTTTCGSDLSEMMRQQNRRVSGSEPAPGDGRRRGVTDNHLSDSHSDNT